MLEPLQKRLKDALKKGAIVTDYPDWVLAEQILNTILIVKDSFDKEGYCDHDKLIAHLKNRLSLDVHNNPMHMIMWENWLSILMDLELVNIQTRYYMPFQDWATDEDVKYLQYVIDNQINF